MAILDDMPGDAGPAALLPLPPATFHILLAVADGDRHGYAIIQEVAARTGGEVRLSAGTLYRSIQRMVEQDLIEETAARPAPGARRRAAALLPHHPVRAGRGAGRDRAPAGAGADRQGQRRGGAEGVMRGLPLAAPPLPRRPARGIRRRDGRDLRPPARRTPRRCPAVVRGSPGWPTSWRPRRAAHADMAAQDLRDALRTCRRNRGYAAAVVAVSALGVGAATAAFSLTDHVLIRPLPFAEPERLVKLWQDKSLRRLFADGAVARQLRGLAAAEHELHVDGGVHDQLGQRGDRRSGRFASTSTYATNSLFETLGVTAAIGRTLRRRRRGQRGARGRSCSATACGGRSSAPAPTSWARR